MLPLVSFDTGTNVVPPSKLRSTWTVPAKVPQSETLKSWWNGLAAPAPVAAQVENYLTGEGGDTDTGSSLIGAAKSALGGMFGKRGESKPDE